MAVNENGNLLDDGGNVVVDHVWGNVPMQPNDVREENGGGLLDPDLDNHSIAYEGWNGYPLYVPNSGSPEGAGFIVVPSVLGFTVLVATNVLTDAGLDVTVGTAATNAAIDITAVERVAESTTATVTAAGAGAAFPVGTKIVIASLAAPNTGLNGTWTVTASTTNTVSFVSSASTALSSTELEAGTIAGLAGTVKTQSLAAGADEVKVGDAITIVAYAAAS
jgi:hypothetical protein